MTALPRYLPVARPVRAGIDPVPQPSCLELAYGKSGLTGLHSNLVVIHHRPQFQTLSGSVSSMDRSHHRSSALDKSPDRHTNKPVRDSVPVPIQSVRVTDSPAKSRTRASDAPRGAFPYLGQHLAEVRAR